MAEVMTPQHERWDEFMDRLSGPEGCDFRMGENEKPTWNCSGEEDKPYARAILESIGMDVAESLAYFESQGGYCDCEIVFNVGE